LKVNFVRFGPFVGRISNMARAVGLFSAILVCFHVVGCSDDIILPSAGQFMEFQNAGPLRPTVDMSRLARAKIAGGPYVVVKGDVLELNMPSVLQVVAAEEIAGLDRVAPYAYRVGESGTVTLPLVGQIKAAGKTLAQIESALVNAYYPAYSATRPYIFVRVMEYRTAKVSITGAVKEPGIYSLRSDQMSLVALLMEAGGIVDQGAAVIRIIHADQSTLGKRQAAVGTVGDTAAAIVADAFGRSNGLSATVPVKSSAPYSVSNEIEIQLTFRQESASSSVGRLTMARDGKVLLAEQIDIKDRHSRLFLLRKLAQIDSSASTADMERKLSALADLLDHANSRNYIEREIPTDNAGSSSKPRSHHAKGGTTLRNRARSEPSVSNSQPAQDPWSQVSPTRSQYATPGRESVAGNPKANPGAKLYTSPLGLNANAGQVFGGRTTEIAGLGENPRRGRITEPGRLQGPETVVLPIKGLNIPFADVPLQDGDSVIVERLELPLFTVMGLVNRPGNFPHPPDVRYNLMQALAFAGGLNQAADPRYATVYRLTPDGTIVSAAFEVANIRDGSQLTAALNVSIKPGDIVAVEHTPRTRTQVFLDRVFRINIGTYLRLDDAWE
jgi:protein involved in polysaccharide export with SLBB domain